MGTERPRDDPDQRLGAEWTVELRRALVRREAPAPERFFEVFFDRIHAFVGRMVRDVHVAEDLTQEVLLRVHRGLEAYEPERPLSPWVFTIAANVVRDHLRSRAWNAEQGRVSLDDEQVDVEPLDVTSVSSELEHVESSKTVARVVESLPISVRRVFLLRHFEGLSFAQVAATLDLTEPAARQRFRRAVLILRERLLSRERDVEPTP
jgi:RNA polymerase sigma-70 factor (ECF subfamily)